MHILLIQIQPWHSEIIIPFIQLFAEHTFTIYYPSIKENNTDAVQYYLQRIKHSANIKIIDSDKPQLYYQLQAQSDLIIFITIPFNLTEVLYPSKTWVVVHCATQFQKNPKDLNYLSLTPLIKRPPDDQVDSYGLYDPNWYTDSLVYRQYLPQLTPLPFMLPMIDHPNPTTKRLPHIVVIGMAEYYSQNGKDIYGLFDLASELYYRSARWKIIIYTRNNHSLKLIVDKYPNVELREGIDSMIMNNHIRQVSFITTGELPDGSIYTTSVYSGALTSVMTHNVPLLCTYKMADIYNLQHPLCYHQSPVEILDTLLNLTDQQYVNRFLRPLVKDQQYWHTHNQQIKQQLLASINRYLPPSKHPSGVYKIYNDPHRDGNMQSIMILQQIQFVPDDPIIIVKHNYHLRASQAFKRLQDIYYTFYRWKIIYLVEQDRLPSILTWMRILHYRVYLQLCTSLKTVLKNRDFWKNVPSQHVIVADSDSMIINYKEKRTDMADRLYTMLITDDLIKLWGHPQFYYYKRDLPHDIIPHYDSQQAEQGLLSTIIQNGTLSYNDPNRILIVNSHQLTDEQMNRYLSN